MVTNVSNMLATQYGTNAFTTLFGAGTTGATGTGTAGTVTNSTALSATVAARVQQALAPQQNNIALLNASLASSQTRLSGLGQLQSALDVFEALAESLAGAGVSTSASSSETGVLTAVTGAAARPGQYKVDVRQLAQGQVLNSGTSLSASSTLGSGMTATVELEWGTLGTDGFQANAGTAKTVTIDSSNNTLEGIAAALKDAGVNATVVKASGGYALQINGEEGAARTLSISVSGDPALKAALGFDPDNPRAGGMAQAQAAQDALVSVAGKDYTSSTNTITGAIEGTTLTLTGEGESKVTITQDSSQIAKNVAAFVKGYNDLSAKLASLQDGALDGDPALARVSAQLAALVRLDGSSSARALADVGISRGADGMLALDDIKLKAAIATDADGVAKLFTNEGRGLADRIDAKLETLTAENGLVRRAQDYASRDLEQLSDRRARMAQTLTIQAQALATMYTAQEQMGGTGMMLDWWG
ncbi:flagellar filament capping protein FliD [Massilia dura]|uniref:Flagellar hook-associated protein 2 n=1 Tax=Pseudoduganella dura TaxID=321982 RepID=A0A6I3X5U6_9BURK|nr:flagellar filament capping protein FliD [Pseudoduganella dura]MUI11587.1 flagellar filament capping protein FliD [Pseudoduganella dura]GGY15071.1 flagellar hook-associated protein 2 [Pseudoduganella dura]